jgi:hypothetical protein
VAFQKLRSSFKVERPQVKLLSPKTDEVLSDTTVSVRFQVKDFPIFKNPEFGIGPHLKAIVDNQPYIEVYEPDQPLILEGLSPGTHTLRVFASTPWNESWKTEGAYAQTSFHIFAKTAENNPDLTQPLLTYSSPQGGYGAEPILLDFYLNNGRLTSQDSAGTEGNRVRATVNGQSFFIDKWQPIYLKGFKSGKNWVRLELLDKEGKPANNVFNDTLRLIDYEPNGQDSLSRLVRGEISAAEAGGIVDRNYTYQPPEPTPTPTPETLPILPSEEETSSIPAPEESPEAIAPSPEILETPEIEETPSVEETPAVEATPPPVVTSPSGGFFNRFRRSAPSPSVVIPPPIEEIPSPTPEIEELPSIVPSPEVFETPEVEETPAVEATPPPVAPSPSGGFFSRFRRSTPSPSVIIPPPIEEIPSPTPEIEELPLVSPFPGAIAPSPEILETPSVEETPAVEVTPPPVAPSPTGGFFSRFRQPAPSPSVVIPPIEETPSSTPEVEELPSIVPSPEVLETPEVEETPAAEVTPSPVAPSPSGGFFSRFRQPTPSPSVVLPPPLEEILSPTPEVEEAPVTEVAPPLVTPSPSGGFFGRFRQPAVSPSSLPEETFSSPVPVEETPAIEPSPVTGLFKRLPQPEETLVIPTPVEEAPAIEPLPTPSPTGGFFGRFRQPAVSPSPSPEETLVIPTPVEEAPEIEPLPTPSPTGGFFGRFRQPAASPTPMPEEAIVSPAPVEEAPAIEPSPVTGLFKSFRQPQETIASPAPVEQAPAIEPLPTPSPAGGFFGRLRQPAVSPSPVAPSPEVARPKTAEEDKLRIIQAPSDVSIPSYYLEKSASPTPATEESGF